MALHCSGVIIIAFFVIAALFIGTLPVYADCENPIQDRACSKRGSVLNCANLNVLVTHNCSYRRDDTVRTLDLSYTAPILVDFARFSSLRNLQKVRLKSLKQPLRFAPFEFKKVLNAFPTCQAFDFTGTPLLFTYNDQKVVRTSILTGISLFSTVPPLSLTDFNLAALEHVSLTVRNELDTNFLQNLRLPSLYYRDLIQRQFQWDYLTVEPVTLETLQLELPLITSFPTNVTYSRLRSLSIKVNNVPYQQHVFLDHRRRPLLRLEHLTLDGVVFSIEISLPPLSALETFTIIHSDLNDIAFSSLPRTLRSLHLQQVNLFHLTDTAFLDNDNIQDFILTESNLQTVNLAFARTMKSLRVLNLSMNAITHFQANPTIVAMLRDLETIDLSHNLLATFPMHLLGGSMMQSIYLQNNSLSIISDQDLANFAHHSDLLDINLQQNPLQCSCSLIQLHLKFAPDQVIHGTCNSTQVINQLTYQDCPPLSLPRSKRYMSLNSTTINFISDTNPANSASLNKLQSDLKASIESSAVNILRPEYGVGFRHAGNAYIGVQYLYAHVYVTWPPIILPTTLNPSYTENLCSENSDDLLWNICQDFRPLFEQLVKQTNFEKIKFQNKLKQLSELVTATPTDEATADRARIKRQTIDTSDNIERLNDTYEQFQINITTDTWKQAHKESLWLSIFLPPAGGARHALLTRQRSEAFIAAIAALDQRQELLKNAHIELAQNLSTAMTVIADTFEETASYIRELNGFLLQTQQNLENTMTVFNDSLNVLHQQAVTIRMISILSSRYLSLWNEQLKYYSTLNQEAEHLLDAMQLLSDGKISHVLIPPTIMKTVASQVITTINKWDSSMIVLHDTLNHYYHYSDVVFAPIDHGLVIQLRIPIYPVNGKKYQLYKVKILHVPITYQPEVFRVISNQSYSKIVNERSYLGVAETNFVEMNEPDLESCSVINSNYLCNEMIMELDNEPLTCLSAIFLNASVSRISEFCDIRYYSYPFKPPPTIIDADPQVLVAGLSQPWRYQCLNHRMPTDLIGSPYSIIAYSSLCKCSVTGTNAYVSRRSSNCEENPSPSLLFTQIHNAVAEDIFQSQVWTEIDAKFIGSERVKRIQGLLRYNSTLKIPKIDLSTGTIKLRELSQLLLEHAEELQIKYEAIAPKLSFTAWFQTQTFPKAFSMAGASCGFIALIFCLYIWCRGHYGKGMVRSLMFASSPTLTNAYKLPEFGSDPEIEVSHVTDISAKSLMLITLSHLLVLLIAAMIIYILKKIVLKLCREHRFTHTHPELKDHPKTEIYMEIHCGTKRLLLYLMTIKAHVSKLHFSGMLTPTSLIVDTHRFYSLMRINWRINSCHLTLDDIEIDLPALVQVPLYKRKTLIAIMNCSFHCNILATEGLYFYKLMSTQHKKVSAEKLNPYTELLKELKEKELTYYPSNDESFSASGNGTGLMSTLTSIEASAPDPDIQIHTEIK